MSNKQTLGLESKRKVCHNSLDDVCFCSIYYLFYGSALKAYTLDASYGSSTCPEAEVTKIIWTEVYCKTFVSRQIKKVDPSQIFDFLVP
jgi:hypothetical protein